MEKMYAALFGNHRESATKVTTEGFKKKEKIGKVAWKVACSWCD